MDLVSALANLSVSLARQRVDQDVGIAVVREQRETREAAAGTLIDGLLPPPVLPEHLGRHVNRRV